jgi:hypothetical protein
LLLVALPAVAALSRFHVRLSCYRSPRDTETARACSSNSGSHTTRRHCCEDSESDLSPTAHIAVAAQIIALILSDANYPRCPRRIVGSHTSHCIANWYKTVATVPIIMLSEHLLFSERREGTAAGSVPAADASRALPADEEVVPPPREYFDDVLLPYAPSLSPQSSAASSSADERELSRATAPLRFYFTRFLLLYLILLSASAFLISGLEGGHTCSNALLTYVIANGSISATLAALIAYAIRHAPLDISQLAINIEVRRARTLSNKHNSHAATSLPPCPHRAD